MKKNIACGIKGKLLLFIVIAVMLNTSNLSIGLKMIGTHDKDASVSYYSNDDKVVAFTPKI